MPNLIAFDQANRYKDENGNLFVNRSHISKATVNPYIGKEIPNFEELGLDPNKVYNLLRHPDELKKAADTFKNMPILMKHIATDADNFQKEHVIGSIGSNVSFVYPYLDADLSFWRGDAVKLIEANAVRELSPSYYYEPDMTPGTFEGMAYDGIMRNIRGNHLALVEIGRTGHDVLVADSNPFEGEIDLMKATALKEALAKKLAAMDSGITPEKFSLAFDEAMAEKEPDAVEPDKEKAEDEEEDKDKKGDPAKDTEVTESKPEVKAEDEEETEAEKKQEAKAAQDAMRAEIMAHIVAMDSAKREVRPVVGEIQVAMDSAADVYKFALKQMGVAFDGMPDAGLGILFNNMLKAKAAAPKAKRPMAADSGESTFTAIPALKRFCE